MEHLGQSNVKKSLWRPKKRKVINMLSLFVANSGGIGEIGTWHWYKWTTYFELNHEGFKFHLNWKFHHEMKPSLYPPVLANVANFLTKKTWMAKWHWKKWEEWRVISLVMIYGNGNGAMVQWQWCDHTIIPTCYLYNCIVGTDYCSARRWLSVIGTGAGGRIARRFLLLVGWKNGMPPPSGMT